MSQLAQNLLLALAWVLLHADFSFGRLAAGFVMGFAAIVLGEAATGRSLYAQKALGATALAAAFVEELVLSSLALARDILRARPEFHPAFVRLDVRELGPAETILLANLISLTPGTLTIDSDPVERALYIHSLYARDPRELAARLGVFVTLIRRAAGRGPGAPPGA